jgi:hypothetical protein
MKKMFIVATALLFSTGAIASQHQVKASDSEVLLTPYLGCYAKTDVEKLLNQGEFVTLMKSNGPDGRINELWVNGSGYTTTVAYPAPKKTAKIDKVCVTNVTKSTVYNGDVIKVMSATYKK